MENLEYPDAHPVYPLRSAAMCLLAITSLICKVHALCFVVRYVTVCCPADNRSGQLLTSSKQIAAQLLQFCGGLEVMWRAHQCWKKALGTCTVLCNQKKKPVLHCWPGPPAQWHLSCLGKVFVTQLEGYDMPCYMLRALLSVGCT